MLVGSQALVACDRAKLCFSSTTQKLAEIARFLTSHTEPHSSVLSQWTGKKEVDGEG